MTMAALSVFAVIGAITWLAVMAALFYCPMRTAPDSPVGPVPFVLAFVLQ